MSFNVFQQVFALSLGSNLVNDYKGTQASLQAALQRGLDLYLPTISPDLKVAWGPVVWKHNPEDDDSGPDNSWFIAFHPALEFEDGSVHPTYVIAVAGTPTESLYVWFNQNFAVGTVTNFKDWVAGGIQNRPERSKSIVPGNPYIATGTVNAVYLLLNTTAPADSVSAGRTLLDFLSNLDRSESTRFITTGHSLGGALSPSLGLSLVNAGIIPGDRTLTYPTAGPSPGNIYFTQLFSETFPGKSAGARAYQGWNVNLVNTIDPVPQAWCSIRSISPDQNLFRIPPIYGLPVLPAVQGPVALAVIWSRISGVYYGPLPSQYFTGDPPPAPPTSLEEFIKIFGWQHIVAYTYEIGVPIPQEIIEKIGKELTKKTEKERLSSYPLIIDLEWEREHPDDAKKILEDIEGKPEVKPHLGEWEVGSA